MTREVPYPHPGEILLEEFLVPMGISQYRLAKEIGVPQRRIGEIVAGKRAITVDTGLRLSAFFGMSEGFWCGLQLDYDAARARESLAGLLARIRPYAPEPSPAGSFMRLPDLLHPAPVCERRPAGPRGLHPSR